MLFHRPPRKHHSHCPWSDASSEAPTATGKSVHGQSLMQRRPRCPKPNAASAGPDDWIIDDSAPKKMPTTQTISKKIQEACFMSEGCGASPSAQPAVVSSAIGHYVQGLWKQQWQSLHWAECCEGPCPQRKHISQINRAESWLVNRSPPPKTLHCEKIHLLKSKPNENSSLKALLFSVGDSRKNKAKHL